MGISRRVVWFTFILTTVYSFTATDGGAEGGSTQNTWPHFGFLIVVLLFTSRTFLSPVTLGLSFTFFLFVHIIFRRVQPNLRVWFWTRTQQIQENLMTGGFGCHAFLDRVQSVRLVPTSASRLPAHPVGDDEGQTHHHEDEAQRGETCSLQKDVKKKTKTNIRH